MRDSSLILELFRRFALKSFLKTMSKAPYLGSKISLISNSEIRYEGILYTVDTKESTIALAKVRSFGTEDRPTERPVAPRNEIYEYIIFRVSDIKDLHVCEPPKLIAGPPHDPAIVQHSPPVPFYSPIPYGQAYETFGLNPFSSLAQSSYNHHMSSILSAGHYSGERIQSRSTAQSQRKSSTTDTGVQVSVDSLEPAQDPRIEARNQMRQRTRDAQINYQNQRRVNQMPRRSENFRRGLPRRGRGRGAGLSSTELLKFESEYDFEQANAEFQELESKLEKNKIVDDSSQQSSVQSSEDSGFYDRKKSFFDDISCEATQRMKGFDWRIERKLNVETFGASANNSWLRRRRGRGRGGFRRGFRNRGGYTRSIETQPKTVTFGETPAIKEVEREPEEKKMVEFPVIEITVEKEKDWPEEKGDIWN